MAEEKFLTYKGRPLVRTGNLIFYGDLNEKYYTMISILQTENKGDVPVATKVEIQLLLTDKNIPAKDALVKKAVKDGLYPAMDLAAVWLEMENAKPE